jgi:hypothetical protein
MISLSHYLVSRGRRGEREPTVAFFALLAHVPGELAKWIRSRPEPRSTERGNPKGSGLEGSRGASYAET